MTDQRKASSAEDMTRKRSIGKLYEKVNSIRLVGVVDLIIKGPG